MAASLARYGPLRGCALLVSLPSALLPLRAGYSNISTVSWAGEESEHKEEAADQLKPGGNGHERRQPVHPHPMVGRREMEELLAAVLEKEQPDDDAKKAEENRFPALQK